MPEESNNETVQFYCTNHGEFVDVSVDDLDDERYDISNGRGSYVCRECFEADYIVCVDCSTVVHYDYCFSAEDELRCESCHDNMFVACYSCSEYIRNDRARVRGRYDDQLFCDQCAEDYDEEHGYGLDDDHSSDRTAVHNYGYKPDPWFYWVNNGELMRTINAPLDDRTRRPALMMGFELEMECSESRFVADQTMSHAYLKDDGSIQGDGFELVTHPHTLDAYKGFFPWGWMETARQNGARAWNNRSCGLHIHFSKDSLSGRSHFARLWVLLHRNTDEWVRFAGRRSTYAVWDEGDWTTVGPRAAYEYPFPSESVDTERIDYYRWTHEEIAAAEARNAQRWDDYRRRNRFTRNTRSQNGRYVALNCGNPYTFELRFFRPSMKANTIIASLESVAAAIEYTRGLTVIKDKGDLQTKKDLLSWQSFRDWVRANKDTYPYLDARIDVRFGTTPDADDASA